MEGGLRSSRKTGRLLHSLELISKMAVGLKTNLEVALGLLSLAELITLSSVAQHQPGQPDSQAVTEPVSLAAVGMKDQRATGWITWTQIPVLTRTGVLLQLKEVL